MHPEPSPASGSINLLSGLGPLAGSRLMALPTTPGQTPSRHPPPGHTMLGMDSIHFIYDRMMALTDAMAHDAMAMTRWR